MLALYFKSICNNTLMELEIGNFEYNQSLAIKILSLVVAISFHTVVHYPTRDLLRALGLLKQGVTIFTIFTIT